MRRRSDPLPELAPSSGGCTALGASTWRPSAAAAADAADPLIVTGRLTGRLWRPSAAADPADTDDFDWAAGGDIGADPADFDRAALNLVALFGSGLSTQAHRPWSP